MLSLFLLTPLKYSLLILIAILGATILRYSWIAFAGEIDRRRFFQALLMTMGSVVLVIISNHLMVFWLAWVAVSLCLHRLILFYPLRPRAQLAAHKKFLLARFSEGLLAVAFVFLYRQFDTLAIDEIVHLAAIQGPSVNVSIAATLLAIVAMIKCAQLPAHGWLIQVVEAPTPVSALLHAGIVNLGGILLLFFAPVLAASALATWLVVVLAGVSTVVAGLVSTTRISIKVKLAWSTSSQMGLMLVEVALGLYEMALLHLFAHSFYKAYSFLNSGNTVNHYLAAKLAGKVKPSIRHWGVALVLSALVLIVGQVLFSIMTSAAATMLVWFALAALVLPSVAHQTHLKARVISVVMSLILAALLLTLYTLAKHNLAPLMGLDAPLNLYADLLIAVLFEVLFVLSIALQYWPHQPWVKKLFIWLNAGAYLDEWATRITLRLWPSTTLIQMQSSQWQSKSEAK